MTDQPDIEQDLADYAEDLAKRLMKLTDDLKSYVNNEQQTRTSRRITRVIPSPEDLAKREGGPTKW